MTDDANADQIAFWTTGPGRHWVDRADQLDELHAGALAALLDAADPQPGETVLDVGCGAGASTLELARRVAPQGRVQGIDVAGPLLDLARRRTAAARLDNATFLQADAQTHRFPPAAADLIASRFGMMFFDDPAAAFRNLGAAMRPGGRLVFAAWTGSDRNVWFRLPMRIGRARLGDPPKGRPDAPGPMAFADEGRVLDLLHAAGFADPSARAVPFELHLSGGVPALLEVAQVVGPLPRFLREMNASESDAAAIRDALRTELQQYAIGDEVRLPAETWIYSAQRP